ncbi:IS3 family transposase [Lactobacillus sp. DCY120]|uniref:IS3 family transposase n=1 Tax=Bombilactobacillus apium TaxID=2675299 RepID=A0A850RBI6_9LACO|nr:IS3 family transposase [Bombilactobacillus apium]
MTFTPKVVYNSGGKRHYMENFFSLLKQEIYRGREYYNFEELEQAIDSYIHYYNHERMKGKIN